MVTRFFAKIDKNGPIIRPELGHCWISGHTPLDTGYTSVFRTKLSLPKHITGHRLSWILHHGPIPQDFCVLHKCDVRKCVNPDHLFLGTRVDNMSDMRLKMRAASGRSCGECHGMHKLTESEVIKIRQLLAAKCTTRTEIAVKYKVSRSTIAHIATGYTWKSGSCVSRIPQPTYHSQCPPA